MNNAKVKVRGLEDCSGLWGTLNIGEEKEIPADIAESLIRGGLAEDPSAPKETIKKATKRLPREKGS